MQPNKAYDEVIEFIASSSPQNVIAFRPSEEAKARVADLILRENSQRPELTTIWQMARWISTELRRAIADRANLLCEYCLIAEADTFYGC